MSEDKVVYTTKGTSDTAVDILAKAAKHMTDRAASYDAPQGERSMARTVEAFNALTGNQLTEVDGWFFMACLKIARSNQGDYRADNYEDGTAYMALAGEAAAKIHNNKVQS